MSNIYILSEPIQTGKTTLLMRWVESQNNIGGILTPDVNGKRKLYDVTTKMFYDLQLNEHEDGIKVGRFVFDGDVFNTAQNLLQSAIKQEYNWVVVDEIGRLEMDRNEGLEPSISIIIEHFKNNSTQTKLLLVIRDYLLDAAIEHYQLHDATVLDKSFFEWNKPAETNLNGLVLCGGKSVRMGHDKAFIHYHQKPQYAHVANALNLFCNKVYISCSKEQKPLINQQYKAIIDSATFANTGPMAGVLTAFEQVESSALIVLGCDYPYLNITDMLALINARNEQIDVVCFKNSETNFEEPLLAIYEKQCAPLLLNYFNSGNISLRHFLKTVNTKQITTNNKNITSVDTNLTS